MRRKLKFTVTGWSTAGNAHIAEDIARVFSENGATANLRDNVLEVATPEGMLRSLERGALTITISVVEPVYLA